MADERFREGAIAEVERQGKMSFWRRIASFVWSESRLKRAILPGDHVEKKVETEYAETVVAVNPPILPPDESRESVDPLLREMTELEDKVRAEILSTSEGREYQHLMGTVWHLEQTLLPRIKKKKRLELKNELNTLAFDLGKVDDREAAVGLLEERLSEVIPERGIALFERNPELFRDLAKIEVLIEVIRRGQLEDPQNGRIDEPKIIQKKLTGREVVEPEEVGESEVRNGRRFEFGDRGIQLIAGREFQRDEQSWPFRFLEVERLPNCASRERDVARLEIGSDQLRWLHAKTEVSLDEFRVQHLKSDREESVLMGMMLTPELAPFFERALDEEGYDAKDKSKLGTMEVIFYRDVLRLISEGRSKVMRRPNTGGGIAMFNGTNGGAGEKRVYYVDLGRIEGKRVLVLVAGCKIGSNKSEQKDLFKFIIAP